MAHSDLQVADSRLQVAQSGVSLQASGGYSRPPGAKSRYYKSEWTGTVELPKASSGDPFYIFKFPMKRKAAITSNGLFAVHREFEYVERIF